MLRLPLRTVLFLTLMTATGLASALSGERIDLRLDVSQAEAVLALVARRAAGDPVTEDDWQRIFGSEPHRRLAEREAALQRPFTEEAFRAFVLTDALANRAPRLRHTLDAWRSRDLEASARRVLAYLPPDARVQATVYVVIKPQPNSFVYDLGDDPAIFLYLDPEQTAAAFENTVAHELHHIGFAGVSGDSGNNGASEPARIALEWMSAFGEGFAMLAAAGNVDTHPHDASPPGVRGRWDRDLASLDDDLRALESFFLDIIDGRLEGGALRERGYSFFGVQGPWYTVGYRMAVVVERRFGRAELIAAMADPGLLLARYNEAAAELSGSGSLPLWSPRLLDALRP